MGYAPPELFQGKVEPRSDLYSLGAALFHMLTGSDPQDNPLLIFDFSKNPAPRQINPAITPEMEQILIKMVGHKPEERHASALELMRVLEQHCARLEARGPAEPSRRVPRTSGRIGPQSGVRSPAEVRNQQPAAPPPSAVPPSPASVPADSASEAALEWVFCGHCGEKIGSDDVYCAHCGSRQPIVGGAAGSAGAGRPSTGVRVTAQLVVVGTNDMVKPFAIDKESVLLGRTDPHTGIFPEIDLTMYDPETKVSRRHARIYRQGEQFLVEDLGSVNGTIVNSVSGGSIRLNTKSPRVLSVGDELKLGGTVLKFMIV
jgi:serine/threonine-protein kinase